MTAIVAPDRFILATRHTGYRGTVAAVAELIDNALQADAKRIEVRLQETAQRIDGVLQRDIEVAVLDDGRGMTREELGRALQFGGTTRFDDRRGLGRFGMGLPNSSVSQSRRIDVFTWQVPGQVLRTHLDVDEVAGGRSRFLRPPGRGRLPDWVIALGRSQGTLVVWSRCDRLDYRKGQTLVEKLLPALGRIYRRALWNGVTLTVNGVEVAPVDPLFCHPVTGEGGGTAYGPELRYEFTLPEDRRPATVTVRFTELPVEAWAAAPSAEKRERGIVGGAGLSILRAGREIDVGWKLFGAKRRENYDDWWRCELSFEPALDEEFGVTHSKQGVAPSARIREAIAPGLEAIARTLNARVRARFRVLKQAAPGRAEQAAARGDSYLPREGGFSRGAWGVTGIPFRIRQAALDTPMFFRTERHEGALVITINTEHPFFDQMYHPARTAADPAHRVSLELLLLSAARAGLSAGCDQADEFVCRYMEHWSDALHAFLEQR